MLLIIVAILAIIVVYMVIIKPYSYWTDRGVKQRKQIYLTGDSAGVIFRKVSFFELMRNLYNAFPEERYMGMYQILTPALVLKDPDLIKQVTVKDFDHFVDHNQLIPDGVDPLWNQTLFSLRGNRWRDIRSTLSPSFTSSKMKAMFNLISDCAADFSKHFLEKGDGVTTVELKDSFTRYTNDVIATAVFGVHCDSLKERDNYFYVMGKRATTFSFWRGMIFFAYTLSPKVCKALGITMFPKSVTKFFIDLVTDTIRQREEKGVVRPDMLSLLMEARKGRDRPEEKPKDAVDTGFATVAESTHLSTHKFAKKEITDVDIAAQAVAFFFGGFETVSTLMCFMGYELAVNAEIQRKLQEEVDDVREQCGGAITYEALMKMKYLDMVVSETLRKWPPGVATDRVCTKPYTIEPVAPNERPIHLQKGDLIWLPVSGFHWDPENFPEPEKFDPERFSDENKGNIKPYTYFPFGLGPRNCVGSRFALLEVKTVFFHLLSKFDLVVVEQTQIPLQVSKTSINLKAEKDFWVGLKPRVLSK